MGFSVFCVSKKTGDIRIVTDFRELNKWVEVDPFPLPRINETLQKLEKFKSVTALGMSLGSIRFHLIKKARNCAQQSFPGGSIDT